MVVPGNKQLFQEYVSLAILNEQNDNSKKPGTLETREAG